MLNAKNYGIPQNRERIYAISVREDIDNNQDYTGHITHNKYYTPYFSSRLHKHRKRVYVLLREHFLHFPR